MNLHESGVDVVVGLARGSKSRAIVEELGLKVMDVADAVRAADVVMILVPDTAQKAVYDAEIAPNLKPGSLLLFAHGFNIHFGRIDRYAKFALELRYPLLRQLECSAVYSWEQNATNLGDTGDAGDTSLFDGTRVRKTDLRVVAYGDVDEVQATLGVVRAADFARGLPLLQCFAENITHVGPVGAGHRMKLLHNYVSLGSAALIAEAAACARIGGIDPQVLVEVLAKGGGGGAALERMRQHLTQGDPTGLQFTLSNALKDLTYYNTMAEQAQADRIIAAAVAQTLKQATEQGDPMAYVPQLVERLVERKPR